MDFNKHLKEELGNLSSIEKAPIVSQDELAEQIYKLLMSKKFRKYASSPSYQSHIKKAVLKNVQNNEPIKLTLVFGAYKLWRLEESPEVDWAELFSLIYYTNWLKPILEVYEPGVWFDFFSDDIIIKKINKISKEDTDAYRKSFEDLLVFFSDYTPPNLNFTFNRLIDLYDDEKEFFSELEKNIEKLREKIFSQTLTERQLKMIELNVKLNPEQIATPNWQHEVLLIHEAYAESSKKRPYYRTSDKILVSNTPVKDSLALGTTKRSVVKFWVGAGLVEKKNNDYYQHILSPKQLEQRVFLYERMNISGLKGKNFQKIRTFLT